MGATEWREFVYDELSGEILMEYTLVGGTFAVKAVNTWGLGLISSNREGVKRYFHFDALGSTRALTDSSGNVTDTYEYNAFGVLESSTGTSVNPYRYVGQWGYYDDGAMGSSSGLLLLGVRYYSPAHGRFWSWDPVPNLNLYAYVENSATMAMDPSGRLSVIIHGNYCGPQDTPGSGRPVDAVDECCCLHDECFSIFGCTWYNQWNRTACHACNAGLCLCLRDALCESDECEWMRRAIMYYACPSRIMEDLIPEHPGYERAEQPYPRPTRGECASNPVPAVARSGHAPVPAPVFGG